MSIFERIATLAKANLNDLIDQAEDPERVAKQVVYNLEQVLRETGAGLSAAIAEEKRLESSLKCLKEDGLKWEKRAIAALEKQEETLAREAVKRKLEADEEASRYTLYLAQQSERVKALKDSQMQFERQLAEAKQKDWTFRVEHVDAVEVALAALKSQIKI